MAQVVGVLSCTQKGCRFYPQSEHILEAINEHFFLSLSLSSLKLIKTYSQMRIKKTILLTRFSMLYFCFTVIIY